MKNKIYIPPIKSQGIKTKLVPQIKDLVLSANINNNSRWIEPFFGTGVVGFNMPITGSHIIGDTNPHIINLYNEIKCGNINEFSVRKYLEDADKLLRDSGDDGYEYYRFVRNRFNENFDSFDFIFLSRCCFNGMMRFNRKGLWNVPFCKKKDRLSPAYITKICNQIKSVNRIIKSGDWEFNICSFEKSIVQAREGDIIYCDSPYFGRYADFYNAWSKDDEIRLYDLLSSTKAKFILSTWHHNEYRINPHIEELWSNFNIVTTDHFYHNGGNIKNRHSMVEALVFNFDILPIKNELMLF